MHDDGSILAQAIKQCEAISISNGSFQEQHGMAAWVFDSCNSIGRARGEVMVPGTAKDQSTYCSELAGIYSILAFAKKLC